MVSPCPNTHIARISTCGTIGWPKATGEGPNKNGNRYYGVRVEGAKYGRSCYRDILHRQPFDILGNHPRHFRLVVCNLLRAVSVISNLIETRQSRAGKNPIVGLDILDEIFIPSDLDISLRLRDLSLVRRPPADEVCVSGCVDCRGDIHPVGLRRFEAGAHGRTTAVCVRLLSRDLCSVQCDHGGQTKSLDQLPTDHNLLSRCHAVWRPSEIHAQAAYSILAHRPGRQGVEATGTIGCARDGHSIAGMSALLRITDSTPTSRYVRVVPLAEVNALIRSPRRRGRAV
jgi:hypothetical protein